MLRQNIFVAFSSGKLGTYALRNSVPSIFDTPILISLEHKILIEPVSSKEYITMFIRIKALAIGIK